MLLKAQLGWVRHVIGWMIIACLANCLSNTTRTRWRGTFGGETSNRQLEMTARDCGQWRALAQRVPARRSAAGESPLPENKATERYLSLSQQRSSSGPTVPDSAPPGWDRSYLRVHRAIQPEPSSDPKGNQQHQNLYRFLWSVSACPLPSACIGLSQQRDFFFFFLGGCHVKKKLNHLLVFQMFLSKIAVSCSVLCSWPRNGELRTQKFKSHLLRTQSLSVLPLKPGVGQYIAIHATLTVRDFFLAYFYPSGPFPSIFSPNFSRFLLCWLWRIHGSCAGPQNKIDHLRDSGSPCWVPAEYK